MNIVDIGNKVNYDDTNEGKIFAEEINAIKNALVSPVINMDVVPSQDMPDDTILLRALDRLVKSTLYVDITGTTFNGKDYILGKAGVKPIDLELVDGSVFNVIFKHTNTVVGSDTAPITINIDNTEIYQLLYNGVNPKLGDIKADVIYNVVFSTEGDGRFDILVEESEVFTETQEYQDILDALDALANIDLSIYALKHGDSNNIFKVKDAIDSDDSVNLGQLQAIISALNTGQYVKKSGDTMTGPLVNIGNNQGTPTATKTVINGNIIYLSNTNPDVSEDIAIVNLYDNGAKMELGFTTGDKLIYDKASNKWYTHDGQLHYRGSENKMVFSSKYKNYSPGNSGKLYDVDMYGHTSVTLNSDRVYAKIIGNMAHVSVVLHISGLSAHLPNDDIMRFRYDYLSGLMDISPIRSIISSSVDVASIYFGGHSSNGSSYDVGPQAASVSASTNGVTFTINDTTSYNSGGISAADDTTTDMYVYASFMVGVGF